MRHSGLDVALSLSLAPSCVDSFLRNPDEVEEIFTVPVEQLEDVQDFEQLGTRQVATFEHEEFPARIWGLTADITSLVLRRVFQPAAEKAP